MLTRTWPKVSCDGFRSFPVVEEVVGPALDGLVLCNDLHLKTGNLSLNGRVLATDDLVEGAPFALKDATRCVRMRFRNQFFTRQF